MIDGSLFYPGKCECGSEAPFVDYDRCPACLGVTVLSLDESKAILEDWETKSKSHFESLTTKNLPPTDVLGALLLAESFEKRTRDDLIVLQDRPWAILAALTKHPLTVDSAIPYSGAFIKSATLATDTAALNQLHFDVQAGLVHLVREDHPKGYDLPRLDFGPEIPLRLRRNYWMNATRLPFGQIPTEIGGTEEIEDWFSEDDPAGSFLALFKEHNLSVAPIFANFQRQFYKIWAPTVVQQLSSMKPQRVRALVDFLNNIEGNAVTKTLEGDKEGDLPFMEVSASHVYQVLSDLSYPTVLTDFLLGATTIPMLPLLVPNPPTYGYPPLLARHYRLLAGGYMPGKSGRQHIQEAGDRFEELVARLLADHGMMTNCHGMELVSVQRAKKTLPDEIDVLAIEKDRIYLLECKAEMDPPGAWTPDERSVRIAKLMGYQERLEEKQVRWRDHLAQGKPIRKGRKKIDLPPTATGADVIAGIVSIRVEPVFASRIPIITLWPGKAAAFAQKNFPTRQLFPIVGHDALAKDLRYYKSE